MNTVIQPTQPVKSPQPVMIFPVPTQRGLKPSLWRMLLSGNRDRIVQAVEKIHTLGESDRYAASLLMIRRRNARRTIGFSHGIFRLLTFTLPYAERERRSALTALGVMWGIVGRELAVALDPKVSHFERRRAHKALVQRRDQRAIRPLIEALLEGHALEDWLCIPTLAALGDGAVVNVFLRYMGLVEDASVGTIDTGIEVGQSLRRLNAREAIKNVETYLESPMAYQRAGSSLVIAGWCDSKHVELKEDAKLAEGLIAKLVALLDDPSPEVRAAVVTGVGHLKIVSALAPLQARLNDENEAVRTSAERAIQQITTTIKHRKPKPFSVVKTQK